MELPPLVAGALCADCVSSSPPPPLPHLLPRRHGWGWWIIQTTRTMKMMTRRSRLPGRGPASAPKTLRRPSDWSLWKPSPSPFLSSAAGCRLSGGGGGPNCPLLSSCSLLLVVGDVELLSPSFGPAASPSHPSLPHFSLYPPSSLSLFRGKT